MVKPKLKTNVAESCSARPSKENKPKVNAIWAPLHPTLLQASTLAPESRRRLGEECREPVRKPQGEQLGEPSKQPFRKQWPCASDNCKRDWRTNVPTTESFQANAENIWENLPHYPFWSNNHCSQTTGDSETRAKKTGELCSNSHWAHDFY